MEKPMEIWSFNDFQIGFDQQIFRYWSRPQTLMRNDDWLLISRHRCTSHGRAKGAPFSSLKLVCRMTLYHDFALNIGILLYFILYNIMYKYIYIYILYYIIKLTNISHQSPSCSSWFGPGLGTSTSKEAKDPRKKVPLVMGPSTSFCTIKKEATPVV